MNKRELKEIIKQDYLAYPLRKSYVYESFFNNGFKVIKLLRKCQYYRSKKSCLLAYYYYRFKYHHYCIKYGFDVPSSVEIGPGAAFFHLYGTVINSKTVIGKNFKCHGALKIGMKGIDKVPVICDDVIVGIGASIIGDVIVGKGSVVGAGAIVTKNVPEKAVVAGNPARILRYMGEKNECADNY